MRIVRSLLALFFALAFYFPTNAQTVKLIRSTEQDWAGGIAGHSGENYNFVIEFTDYIREPVPVTLWLGEEPFKLVIDDSLLQGNTKITRLSGGKRFGLAIRVGTFRDEYADRNPPLRGKDAESQKPVPPKAYKGKALLAYYYKGQESYFEITKITEQLPKADYP